MRRPTKLKHKPMLYLRSLLTSSGVPRPSSGISCTASRCSGHGCEGTATGDAQGPSTEDNDKASHMDDSEAYSMKEESEDDMAAEVVT